MTWMDYTSIKRIQACDSVNSRGLPLLDIEVMLEGDAVGRATVARSTTFDMDNVVANPTWKINHQIFPVLKDMNVLHQRAIDRAIMEVELQHPLERLGSNVLWGISLAIAKAAANSCNLPLFHYLGGAFARRMPVPMFRLLSGGHYANWQGADMQEFMIAPAGASNYSEALRWCSDVSQALETIVSSSDLGENISDTGRITPRLKKNVNAIELIIRSIEEAGYRPGEDIVLAIDAAASQFYENGLYHLRSENCRLASAEMIDMYVDWVQKYPIALLEDGLAKDDWEGWKSLNSKLGCQIELIGDTLFGADVKHISRGIEENVANAILIKPQQIGSISETIDALQLVYDANWAAMISHQCSGMADCFVADFTVAFGTGHIKIDTPRHREQGQPYNPLLDINEYLGYEAVYAGHNAFVRNKSSATQNTST